MRPILIAVALLAGIAAAVAGCRPRPARHVAPRRRPFATAEGALFHRLMSESP